MQSNTNDIISQVPGVGSIPILGKLFSSTNYQNNKTELVIMVTPHLVHAVARGTKLPLPGEREEQQHMPVWGSFLLSPAGSDQMPGFSR